MSRAYRDGRDGGLYTGGGSFTDYLKGQNDTPPQYQPNGSSGGGNGCGYILLFFVVIQILLMVLPIAVPMTISAVFIAIIVNIFGGDKMLSLPVSLTFGQAFRSVFYTYLLYFFVSIFVSSILLLALVLLGIGTENQSIMNLTNMGTSAPEDSNMDFYKLCFTLFVFQIPSFLIAGLIFRYYVSKYLGKIKVSYWRATLFISVALIILMGITGIEFYLWIKYSPETFQSVTKMYLDILN